MKPVNRCVSTIHDGSSSVKIEPYANSAPLKREPHEAADRTILAPPGNSASIVGQAPRPPERLAEDGPNEMEGKKPGPFRRLLNNLWGPIRG